MENNQTSQLKVSEDNVEILKILAHPSRIQIILLLLPNKKLNVAEIVNILQVPQSTVSQHLLKMKGKILGSKRSGLEVYYYITNPKVIQVLEILSYSDRRHLPQKYEGVEHQF